MFAAKTDIPCMFTDIPYILFRSFDRGGGRAAAEIFLRHLTAFEAAGTGGGESEAKERHARV